MGCGASASKAKAYAVAGEEPTVSEVATGAIVLFCPEKASGEKVLFQAPVFFGDTLRAETEVVKALSVPAAHQSPRLRVRPTGCAGAADDLLLGVGGPGGLTSGGSRASSAKGALNFRKCDLEQLQLLDETRLSAVFCYRDATQGGKLVAVKRLRADWPNAREAFENEVRMLRFLANHPNVVDLVGVCEEDKSEPMLVLQLCGGGTLEAWLQLMPARAAEAAEQLLLAIQSLHNVLVVHLDVKPENVLFDDAGRLKLCDFATARQLGALEQRLTGNCGTDGFKAPEVTSGRGYNGVKADVFSTGRTLMAIARSSQVWTASLVVIGDMTADLPEHRPELDVVHAELFGIRPTTAGATSSGNDLLAELFVELAHEPWAKDAKVAAKKGGVLGVGLPVADNQQGPLRGAVSYRTGAAKAPASVAKSKVTSVKKPYQPVGPTAPLQTGLFAPL